MTLNELQAMISLLDDSDTEIVQFVTQDLVSKGYGMYDVLEDICWSGVLEDKAQENVEKILRRITFRNIKPQIEVLIGNCEQNLLAILGLIAQITYPRYSFADSQRIITALIQNIARETNPTYGITRNISEFNCVFYDTYHFRLPDPSNRHLMTNFMLNDVLTSKIGHETLLGLIYWLAAYPLTLEFAVEPIILPTIALLATKNVSRRSPRFHQTDISFYINPADKGNIYRQKEIIAFLNNNHILFDEQMLKPCPIHCLLYEYLTSLASSLEINDRPTAAKEIMELAAMIE